MDGKDPKSPALVAPRWSRPLLRGNIGIRVERPKLGWAVLEVTADLALYLASDIGSKCADPRLSAERQS
jgi:hypothetical protein